MSDAPGPVPIRRSEFSLPAECEWGIAEHSEGVFFAESAGDRVGPFPAEAARCEATRRNEYELILGLAEAVLAAFGAPGLASLAKEPRFAGAWDPLLGAAIDFLHDLREYDGCSQVEGAPMVLIERFVALLGPERVVLSEYDTPAEARARFEVLRDQF